MNLMRNFGYLVCYTDGACPGNGQPGATAGIGVFFGLNHSWNISRPLDKYVKRTSNNAEIYAAIEAIREARKHGEFFLEIRSDSTNVVLGMNEWIRVWEQNGWRNISGMPVENKDAYLQLRGEVSQMRDVKFVYVSREQNKEADKLAGEGAKQDCDQFVQPNFSSRR